MNTRRVLFFILFSLSVFGIAGACSPFIFSLNPNTKQVGALPHVDIGDMVINDVVEYRGKFLHVFIHKGQNLSFNVVAVPHINGSFRLPEFDWNRPTLMCNEFGMSEELVYGCTEAHSPWVFDMKWNYTGDYIGQLEFKVDIPPLKKPRFEVRGDYIILFES
jgi:hypothetical protein